MPFGIAALGSLLGGGGGDDLMQNLFGGSKTKTNQFTLPGIFQSGEDPQRLAGQAEGILGQESDLFNMLSNELMNPSFAPQTSSEMSLINSLMDLTSGRGAVRGLGAPTQQALATSIAPTLTNQRNQRVSNLAQALGIEQGFRGQNLGGLLELGTLAMPQHVFQPETKSSAGLVPALGGLASAGAGLAALCWVADELYGEGSTKAHLARLYASNHDTLFIRVYRKYGKGWAKWLKKHPWAKPFVAPIWDGMVIKGAQMVVGRRGHGSTS